MELFYILLIVIFSARLFGELAEQLGQPALVGELLAGIIIGLLVHHQLLGPALANLPDNEVFKALSELGIFFLMLLGGLEISPRELKEQSKSGLGVALGGLFVPLLLGLFLGYLWLPDSDLKFSQTLLLGTALAITAVPVTIRVLMDLDQLKSKIGQLLVSAAVIDDVLGLFLLAIITGTLQQKTSPGITEFLILGGNILLFFVITFLLGFKILPRLSLILEKLKIAGHDVSFLLIVAFAFGVLAEALHLHFVLGAFTAGVFFSRNTPNQMTFKKVRSTVGGVTHGFLSPIFFVSIGLHFDPRAVTEVPLFLAVFILVAILGKLLGAGLTSRYFQKTNVRDSLAVGFGMSGRGAVELIVAEIALTAGVIGPSDSKIVSNLYSSIVIMAIITTIAAPVALKALLGKK